jgi:polyisoprenoid-binding protein YceI
MTRRTATALGIIAGLGGTAQAAQVWSNPAEVRAGTYEVEPLHTQIVWAVAHLGLTTFYGTFSGASGRLTLDPKHPAASTLSVSIPVASVLSTSAKLDEELKGPQWFDAAKYPAISFVSSKVTQTGRGTARVDGTLTMHGVSKPETLAVKFNGAAVNPIDHSYSVGFEASGSVRRSDFGVKTYVPLVGDDVTLMISGAFEAAK